MRLSAAFNCHTTAAALSTPPPARALWLNQTPPPAGSRTRRAGSKVIQTRGGGSREGGSAVLRRKTKLTADSPTFSFRCCIKNNIFYSYCFLIYIFYFKTVNSYNPPKKVRQLSAQFWKQKLPMDLCMLVQLFRAN